MIHTTFNNNLISINTVNSVVEKLVTEEQDLTKPLVKYLSANFKGFKNVNLFNIYSFDFNEGDAVRLVYVVNEDKKNVVAIERDNSIYYLLENYIKRRKSYWDYMMIFFFPFVILLMFLIPLKSVGTIFISGILLYIPLSFTFSILLTAKKESELKSLINLELAKSSKN